MTDASGLRAATSREGWVSIGPQTEPPIGFQKGPLLRRFVPVVHRRDPRAAERHTGGWRSGAWEVPVNPPVQNAEDDQIRFLNRQLSLPVSTMSQ